MFLNLLRPPLASIRHRTEKYRAGRRQSILLPAFEMGRFECKTVATGVGRNTDSPVGLSCSPTFDDVPKSSPVTIEESIGADVTRPMAVTGVYDKESMMYCNTVTLHSDAVVDSALILLEDSCKNLAQTTKMLLARSVWSFGASVSTLRRRCATMKLLSSRCTSSEKFLLKRARPSSMATRAGRHTVNPLIAARCSGATCRDIHSSGDDSAEHSVLEI